MADNGGEKGNKSETELIVALACGKPVHEAAQISGFSDSAVRRRLKDAGFRAQVSEVRDQMFRETAGMLARSTGAATVTLVALLKDGNPNVKLGAARAILEYATRFAETLQLAERVADLEQRVAEQKHRGKDW